MSCVCESAVAPPSVFGFRSHSSNVEKCMKILPRGGKDWQNHGTPWASPEDSQAMSPNEAEQVSVGVQRGMSH